MNFRGLRYYHFLIIRECSFRNYSPCVLCVGLIDCSHASRGGARISGLESKIVLPSPSSLRPYPIEVAGFERIVRVGSVKAGAPDPWTPWQAPPLYGRTVQKTVFSCEQKLGPSDYVSDFGIGCQKVVLSFSFWSLWPVASPGF
jgi:hypothetical protein